VRAFVEARKAARVALVAPTAADARDVVVEGESGILAVSPPWFSPAYEPSKRRLTWPNGAVGTVFSADEPDRLRGPQFDLAWCDELAAWRYPEAWDMLQMALRLGTDPRAVVTTTPRPTRIIRDLLAAKTTVVTRGATFENRANLAPTFLDQMKARYEGTRIGRQELYADLLDDVPGALWNRAMLDELRVRSAPGLRRIVVAVDPATTSGEHADMTGIIVAAKGEDGHGYVLEDLSCRTSPDAWARTVAAAYTRHKADRVVAEVNQGGDLVESVLRTIDPHLPLKKVHASKGKRTRAEPIAAMYEQRKVHHVGGFPDLEDQACSFTPDGYDGSPDRVDALVWALTELMGEAEVTFSGALIPNGPKRRW
jgi:predicted phage terminase large subunit-like protein